MNVSRSNEVVIDGAHIALLAILHTFWRATSHPSTHHMRRSLGAESVPHDH